MIFATFIQTVRRLESRWIALIISGVISRFLRVVESVGSAVGAWRRSPIALLVYRVHYLDAALEQASIVREQCEAMIICLVSTAGRNLTPESRRLTIARAVGGLNESYQSLEIM